MTIITKQQRKAIRKIQKELRRDVAYVTIVSTTTAACGTCSNETMTGMPYDSFCETCDGKNYTETEYDRVLDATVSISDSRSEYRTFLMSGTWEPGMVKIITDKESAMNPVTNKSYFIEGKYFTIGTEVARYKFSVETIGPFGLVLTVVGRKFT